MRCQVCGGRVHTGATCRHFAPRRKARRVPMGVVVAFRFALWFGGVIVAGRSFDRLNEGTGTGWLGLVVGLVFAFSAVVWPSSLQGKRG